MELSKAGTQNFVQTRLACFLFSVFITIANSPLAANTPYLTNIFPVLLQEVTPQTIPPYLENADKKQVTYAPAKEEISISVDTSPYASVDVVCPDVDLSNEYPSEPLEIDSLTERLITPELDTVAPKSIMNFAGAEPDWSISPVYKEIDPIDFFYKSIVIQNEELPNYLKQIEIEKTLVDVTRRYRESLFAIDYFQRGKGPISTHFSTLIESSQDNLDKRILQNIEPIKSVSTQDQLVLEEVLISLDLEKTPLYPILSYEPETLIETGDSLALEVYQSEFPYDSSLFNFLEHEPILSQPLEKILWSSDLLQTFLDISAYKASQELLSGTYLTDEVEKHLHLALLSQMDPNFLNSFEKFHSIAISDVPDSTLNSMRTLLHNRSNKSSRIQITQNSFKKDPWEGSPRIAATPMQLNVAKQKLQVATLCQESTKEHAKSSSTSLLQVNLALVDTNFLPVNPPTLSPTNKVALTTLSYSVDKQALSGIGFVTNLQTLPMKDFKLSPYIISRGISSASIYQHYPNLQKADWTVKVTNELITLSNPSSKSFIFKASHIEITPIKSPLFLGITRAALDHSQMSDLSFNKVAMHSVHNRDALPTTTPRNRQPLVSEPITPNQFNQTLHLDLSQPSEANFYIAHIEEVHPVLPQNKYPENFQLNPPQNQPILEIALLIDLPILPIKNIGEIPLLTQDPPVTFAQMETTQLFSKRWDLAFHPLDLHPMQLSQNPMLLYKSALSKHSLDIINTNKDQIGVLSPGKINLQHIPSFQEKGALLVSIKPLHFSDTKLPDSKPSAKEVSNVHFIPNDYATTTNFKATTFTTPLLNNAYQVHHTYAPINLLGASPYELTYCFGTSAVDTNRSNRITHLLLSSLPTLSELETDSLDDDFRCEVKVTPHMSQDGYIFSVRFTTNDKDAIDPLPHHIIYLLDRGSSVEDHRFNIFKNAIVKSISQLNPTTRFNVWLFDQEITVLNKKDLHNSRTSINLTKQLLAKVSQGRRSSFSTLLQALNLLNQQATESNELYTVVLLTDGSMMKNVRLHRESLLELALTDPSVISLYTAAVSDNNNLGMLELLAHIGHGEMFYTKTHASFPRKFAQLIKKVSRPIATGLHVTCFSDNPAISLQHMNVVSGQLYVDQSYSVYGSTSDLSHINIIIQGERNGRYINIHKKIPLENSLSGRIHTEKTYYSRKALSEMLEFIFSNDQTHLIRAKELLSPYGTSIASR